MNLFEEIRSAKTAEVALCEVTKKWKKPRNRLRVTGRLPWQTRPTNQHRIQKSRPATPQTDSLCTANALRKSPQFYSKINTTNTSTSLHRFCPCPRASDASYSSGPVQAVPPCPFRDNSFTSFPFERDANSKRMEKVGATCIPRGG